MGKLDLAALSFDGVDRQAKYGTEEVHAEIWIESDEQADKLEDQLLAGAFGKCRLARRVVCRNCPDRMIVCCPLPQWASAVSALGSRGWRVVASSSAEVEADHLPFDTLVLLTRAENAAKAIYDYLADLATRGHAHDEKEKKK